MNTQIILINITGSDKPGLTANFTEILTDAQAHILDIGQAVIHSTLSFGLLIEIDEDKTGNLFRDMLFTAQTLEQQIRFTRITKQNYTSWVAEKDRARYIVTLLSRKITSEQIYRVSSITSNHGLSIDEINRLSSRVDLDCDNNQAKGCIEFSVRGEVEDLNALRADFLAVATELNIDVAFQKNDIYRRNRRLAVFDMDSTLIATEVIDELAYAHGVGDQVMEITEAAMRGELDFRQSFIKRMSLLKGLDQRVLEEIAKNLPITEGAHELFTQLKLLGYKTAILSGGFTYFARHLQNTLGIDYVFANELDIVDGKLTDKVIEPIIDAVKKASLLKEIAQKEGIELEQTIAVGDGANDLPMLQAAGLGVAFHAKPIVKSKASQSISTLGLDGILYLLGFRDGPQ